MIQKNGAKFLALVIFITLNVLAFSFYYAQAEEGTVTISAVVQGCGNGIIEFSEQCDGADLGGQTCAGLGYTSGTLTCNSDCTFNTSNCSTGGGGGGAPSPSISTKVILQGKAYPDTSVTVLKDGKVITAEKADSQANFKVEITNITSGVWTFSIWAKDKQGRRSITFSFTTNISSGMTTTISDIFLPPTIELSKVKLQKGETLNIYGQTAPESEITISVESLEIIKKVDATEEGDWLHSFATTILKEGLHTARAKAGTPEGLSSSYSKVLGFYIGEGAIVAIEKADITNDEKVNLVDFSILLYNWGVAKNPSADFNNDGKVNLVDFSIMMYYWTG
ncbi:hypothetical protein KAU51_02615 [Candidatus Parcubacteria bacterium]|nr:hypothetical protein [Candidatus Parcubacteria bacterium]